MVTVLDRPAVIVSTTQSGFSLIKGGTRVVESSQSDIREGQKFESDSEAQCQREYVGPQEVGNICIMRSFLSCGILSMAWRVLSLLMGKAGV
jgi:hypothetical protein